MGYKLSIGVIPEQQKIGKLKYLVMIFERGKRNGYRQYMLGRFLGFLNDKCQFIGEYFTGNKEIKPFGKIVQLPYLFDTKKQAKEKIKQSRKHDKGFDEKNIYEIVPIDVLS